MLFRLCFCSGILGFGGPLGLFRDEENEGFQAFDDMYLDLVSTMLSNLTGVITNYKSSPAYKPSYYG